MEAFIRPKRECINSWANLFRNNRAKFRTAREISRAMGGKKVHARARTHEIRGVNVRARQKEYIPYIYGTHTPSRSLLIAPAPARGLSASPKCTKRGKS